ncbi:MAG: M15 family metallopeptidase [Tissierellia bacterium]|nr:M15 family metallopeptidase [Tissierellia bacterium]
MDSMWQKPIPKSGEIEDWQKHQFIASPLVPIVAGNGIILDMQYPKLGFTHGEEEALARVEVAEMLQEAAAKLPQGYQLVVWDAWRPFALQKELFESYRLQIIEDFNLKDLPEEEQVREISKFVANPVANVTLPPAHTTGGAVDVTLLGPDGPLEMGTDFDAFTDKTETTYFEDATEGKDLEIRNNRRLLYHLMTSVGFTNLPSEWWHYEYGDRNWGALTGEPALYEGIFEKPKK